MNFMAPVCVTVVVSRLLVDFDFLTVKYRPVSTERMKNWLGPAEICSRAEYFEFGSRVR